jgi:3-hydroxyacyl-CoA dehydrogenase
MSKKLEKVAVNGSGILGTQIAMVAVYGGYSVKIFDPQADAFSATYNKLKNDFQECYPLYPMGPVGKMQIIRSTGGESG